MSRYSYKIIHCGTIYENCVVLMCNETKKGAIFDPGFDHQKIINEIESMGFTPVEILNTHGHYDHIGAVEELRKHFGIKIRAHKKEAEYFEDPNKNLSCYGGNKISFKIDGFVREGEDIKIGNLTLKVLETPGHTKGGVCYLVDDLLIAGDTIFAGSIGRCDLYGGNQDTLLNSIAEKIATLPDNIKIISGHGRETTVGDEKRFNPFMRM
ncbi:MAG: MBL fold metallo-hydrolase [Candidatus Cloacimonadota bacterium]|nr:MAG: MBL fold metallo-hydrolase [Candidatus Cloacimonadota bacterium]PIE79318.1 MAG: MBL fold metallo-hydrolase [Candidatus Delongbacteria bacterium]